MIRSLSTVCGVRWVSIWRLALFVVLFLPAATGKAQTPSKDTPEVEERVATMLHKLTTAEKLALIGGDKGFYIRGLPSIGMPALKMSDGPYGVRTFGRATAYAAGVSLAAAWDPELAGTVGRSMGSDARARGVAFLLAPGVNIYRSPLNGRNFEYFGEDPYLASQTAVGFIKGVQSEGVVATVKHFAGNNSEFDRHNLNSKIDERTLREIYLPAFEASVRQAHVGAVMDGYNLLNGEHLTQNAYLNNRVLKQEWGFKGILMSDWGSTYDGLAAARAGLDLEMPGGNAMNPRELKLALNPGNVSGDAVSIGTVDDKVRRILRTAVRFGFFDRPQLNPAISQYDSGGDEVSYRAALGSITLLRNERRVLPLDKERVRTIAVVGPDADPVTYGGGGSSLVSPLKTTSIMDGISSVLGPKVRVLYTRGIIRPQDLFAQTSFDGLRQEVYSGTSCKGQIRKIIQPAHIADYRTSDYTLANMPIASDKRCVMWTGIYNAPITGRYTVLAAAVLRDSYTIIVNGREVIRQKKSEDQSPNSVEVQLNRGDKVSVEVQYLPDADVDRLGVGIMPTRDVIAPEVSEITRQADAVIVSAGYGPATEGESHDRTFELPYGQEELIRTVAANNARTIVAVASGGGYATAGWLDNVPALLQTWYFGQEGGRALADIIFGHSPEGKLPMTFEQRLEDNPTYGSYYPEPTTGELPTVRYKEGVFVGYRYYSTMHRPVLYPFGFGLSYTSFRFEHMRVACNGEARDPHATVSFDVTNTGRTDGAEVAQVYIGAASPAVPRPERELKSFRKLWLAPGTTRRVTVDLDLRSFAYFDVNTESWKADAGSYQVRVGDSSENLPLRRTVILH